MITLAPMDHHHIDAVHTIETDAAPDPWTRGLFASELEDGGLGRRWLVAERQNGHVIGFGGVLLLLDEAHVMNLAVSPSEQRSGVATLLVARLLLDAGDRGATSATLEVRASNEAARGLYRRFGFEEAGHRPRYYPDGEDAVIMWVHQIYRPEYRDRLTVLAGAEGSTSC